MTDPARTVLGGGGIAEQEGSAVLGGGGIAEQEGSAVLGGGGIAEQEESAVVGAGGMTDPDMAVLGGGGITGPPAPKSRWDVSQVQLAGELSHSKSGWEPATADHAVLTPDSILLIVRLARRFRNRCAGISFPQKSTQRAIGD